MLKEQKLADEIVIDPRKFRKSWRGVAFLCGFWLIWTAMTLFTTYVAFQTGEAMLFAWLIVGYTGVFAVPLSLVMSRFPERVRVDEEGIEIRGPFPPWKFRIAKGDLEAVTLERYESSGEVEADYSLNIFGKKSRWGSKRFFLAQYVATKDKQAIFERLCACLWARGYEFSARNMFRAE